MNNQKQKGSLEIIGVILVVLLLIGGVGFIAWNNFVKKDTADSVVKETEKEDVREARQYKTAEIAESFPVKLSTRYPANWTLKVEGEGPKAGNDDAVQQKISMTSPSKKYTVAYSVISRGGLGGTCIPEMSGVIKSISRDPVAGLSESLFVEVTTNAKGPDGRDSFGYVSGLYPDSDAVKDVKVGDSLCELGLINLVQLSDALDTSLVDANVTINNLNEGQPNEGFVTVTDASIISKNFVTAEYKDAVQILKSMKLSK